MNSSELRFTASGVVTEESGGDVGPERGRGAAATAWDDGASVAMTTTFTRYLMARPSLDEVTRFLVALLCAPVGALGAVIASTHGTQVDTIAQYLELVPGWPTGNEEPLLAGHMADIPLGTARVVHATWTDSEVEAAYVVSIWPLGTNASTSLTLVLLHSTRLDVEKIKDGVKDFVQLLSVYLSNPPRGSRGTRK